MKPSTTTWKVFWDLQCPYSRKNWQRFPAIREHFGNDYDFSVHLTSLLFHPQAFVAQGAANLIERKKGPEARMTFIGKAFENQDNYLNAAVRDSKPAEVDAIFASFAKQAGLFDETFTEEYFLEKIRDWDEAVGPAWAEHKEAIAFGVLGAPKHVISDKLVEGTDSEWGIEEWEEKLKSLESHKKPKLN